MHSFSRFADPFLDTLLVPEDFAAVSRFCAQALAPASRTQGAGALWLPNKDCRSSLADQDDARNGQLQFENL